MLIKATDKPLRVDYKIPGKFYNQAQGENTPTNNSDTHSDFPFDSLELQPGQEWEQGSNELIRVVTLGEGPAAPPVSTDAH